LHVATSSSAWAFELTLLEEQVQARLSEFLGGPPPSRLRFAVGDLPEKGSDPEPKVKQSAPEVSEAHLAEGEEIAAPIADPELREAVAKAAAASLAAARTRADDRPI
jgi:hypothetical protein